MEEWLLTMVLTVVAQAFHRVVGNRRRSVIILMSINRRERFVVFRVLLRCKVPVMIIERVGSIKSVLQRLSVDMPFPRVVGAVSNRFQDFWQEFGPARADAASTSTGDLGQRISSDLLCIVAGQNRRS